MKECIRKKEDPSYEVEGHEEESSESPVDMIDYPSQE